MPNLQLVNRGNFPNDPSADDVYRAFGKVNLAIDAIAGFDVNVDGITALAEAANSNSEVALVTSDQALTAVTEADANATEALIQAEAATDAATTAITTANTASTTADGAAATAAAASAAVGGKVDKIANGADFQDPAAVLTNIGAAANLQAPYVVSPEAWSVAKWVEAKGERPLDTFDAPGRRIAPGVDSTDGMLHAMNSGYAVAQPLRGGEFPISDTIHVETRRASFIGTRRLFNYGSDTTEASMRATSIKLTVAGSEGSPRPLFWFKEEGCYVANALLRGEGVGGYQTAILASKPYASGYNRNAACDFAADNVRYNGFETAIETKGWGVQLQGHRTGDCRNFWKPGFPDPGTFDDPGSGGQSIEQAFRQNKAIDIHLHATTFGVVNEGSQASKINGAQLIGVVADTGCQVFRGYWDGIIANVTSVNGSNVDSVSKTSLMRITGGNVLLANILLAGLANGTYDDLPTYLLQLIGDVKVNGSNIVLRNCRNAALHLSGSGLKEGVITNLLIQNAHQVNDTSPSRLSGAIDVTGNSAAVTVDLRLRGAAFESPARSAYAPIVTADTGSGVSSNGVRVDFDELPVFSTSRYTGGQRGLADTGVRLNSRRDYAGYVRPLAASTTAAASPSATGESVLATITVPGGAVGPSGRVRVRTDWSHSGSGSKEMIVRAGGAGGIKYLSNSVTSSTYSRYLTEIVNSGAENAQKGPPDSSFTFGNATAVQKTSTVPTASDWTIVIAVNKATAGDASVLESYAVEVIYGA